MGVALRHRAEAVVKVEHLVAVDVPDPRSLAALKIDRPRLANLIRGGNSSGKRRSSAFVHRTRLRGALVQRLRLAVAQLPNPLAVDLNRRLHRHDCDPTLECKRRDGPASGPPRGAPATDRSPCSPRSPAGSAGENGSQAESRSHPESLPEGSGVAGGRADRGAEPPKAARVCTDAGRSRRSRAPALPRRYARGT